MGGACASGSFLSSSSFSAAVRVPVPFRTCTVIFQAAGIVITARPEGMPALRHMFGWTQRQEFDVLAPMKFPVPVVMSDGNMFLEWVAAISDPVSTHFLEESSVSRHSFSPQSFLTTDGSTMAAMTTIPIMAAFCSNHCVKVCDPGGGGAPVCGGGIVPGGSAGPGSVG